MISNALLIRGVKTASGNARVPTMGLVIQQLDSAYAVLDGQGVTARKVSFQLHFKKKNQIGRNVSWKYQKFLGKSLQYISS